MQDFRKLKVWKKAHLVTLAAYRVTQDFPQTELYGLTSQLRRASISIAANIAEGCGRNSNLDFARFLQMAIGSACEVEYHFLLARDLGFLRAAHYEILANDVEEVKKMLTVLIQKLKADN